MNIPSRGMLLFQSKCDPAFTAKGFTEWKHEIETNKGHNRHKTFKEHLACFSLWKDKKQRVEKGKQISALVHSDQLQKFATSNQLPVRGKLDAFDDMSEVGSGHFLSVVDFNIRKDPHLAQISLVIHFLSLKKQWKKWNNYL